MISDLIGRISLCKC